VTETLGFLF